MRNPDITYMNQDVPDYQLPTCEGESYEAFVPDTLDLQERANIGIGLIG